MKKISLLISLFLLTSCSQFFQVVPSKWTGLEAYTQHGFHFEKNRHVTTNYIRGFYVSPGTKVKILEVTTGSAKILLDGNQIEIINGEKYTHKTMEEVLDRMFTKNYFVPDISPEFKVNLKTGQPSLGMTKSEVILVLGYPPAHATYKLEYNTWKYWFSRADTKDLIFIGDKLESIRN